MRKRNKGRALSRPKSQKKALLRTMAESLFWHGKIETTEIKAKELKPVAEKFITKAKNISLSNRRLLSKSFSSKVLKKLINEIAPQYKKRNGGYTRIIKLGFRKSDGANVVIVELVK